MKRGTGDARAPSSGGGPRAIRLAILVQDLEFGGIQSIVATLAPAFDRSRFAVEVWCYDGLGPLAARVVQKGIPVELIPRRPGIDLGFVRRLAGRMKRHHLDVVNAHGDTAFFYATLAARWRALGRGPAPAVLYTEHDRTFPSPRRIALLHALLSRMAARVVTVSATLREQLVRHEWVPRSRIVPVLHGVPAARAQWDESREEARNRLGLPRDRRLVGTIGHLTPIKDPGNLLRAMAAWEAEAGPCCDSVFVGDGPLRAALEEEARRLGLAPRVHWLGYREDTARCLRAFDLFVLPSASEGLPIAIVEAMGLELPVVATRVGGNAEIVEEGETGFLVPPGEPRALARAVRRLLEDPRLAARFAKRGRRRFEEGLTFETTLRTYEGLVEEVAARRGRG